MHGKLIASAVVACMPLFFAGTGWAEAPPVNQTLGMPDIAMGDLAEADCRVCHDSGVQDRHHLLCDTVIPSGSQVPYPDADGDGNPDTIYACLNCHDQDFTVVTDCTACHNASAHHTTPAATGGDCVSCHGDLVDNVDDGHYIPTYSPSLVTPYPSSGGGPQPDRPDNGAGACDYCHDSDGLVPPVILTNQDLHHRTGLNCSGCHKMHGTAKIRVCEGCHGPDSLHNIQADSPNPNSIGTIVVGGEDAGFGHVGRDAGPGDSDCWGCHGFAKATLAPFSGPLVPTVYDAHRAVVKAGTDTLVVLSGAAFTNTIRNVLFASVGVLTAADGSSLTLIPDEISEKLLAVTIPAHTAPGNYTLQAVKTDDAGHPVASNPAVISIVPEVIITKVSAGEIVTIEGTGFGGYAEGSGTSVSGKITIGRGRSRSIAEATVVSWSDTVIRAAFGASPKEVTVTSVFGADTSEVGGEPD